MGEWFGLALWLALANGVPPGLVLRGDVEALWPRPWESEAVFHSGRRAVSNWRQESTRWLAADLPTRLALAYADGATLPRCVRMNNYWCVKRAGWSGEIAADQEGHVAFSGALEGAVVAGLLLRRYYVDYNLKTARDVVSRWAPTQCGAGLVVGPAGKAGSGARKVRAGKEAPHLRRNAGTLRARWLARNRPGFTGAKFAGRSKGLRRSAVRDAPVPMMRAPTIAAGVSEAPIVVAPIRLAALSAPSAQRLTPLPALPAFSCAGESQRIENYAARLATGLAADASGDLRLFDSAGEPTANLALALLNMASVEIGPYKVEPALIEDALTDIREVLRLRREAAARKAQEEAERASAPAPPPAPQAPAPAEKPAASGQSPAP
jgi:hypothetical protein